MIRFLGFVLTGGVFSAAMALIAYWLGFEAAVIGAFGAVAAGLVWGLNDG